MVRLLSFFICTCLFVLSPASHAIETAAAQSSAGVALHSAGFNALLEQQIQSGVLTTEQGAAGGYVLRNPVQSLQAQITTSGAVFSSTSDTKGNGGSFSIALLGIGREGALEQTTFTALRREGDAVLRVYESVIEKFSNTGHGIRQDFIVTTKPAGTAPLQVNLNIEGASLRAKEDGFTVSLHDSGRTLTYDRLKVTDANNIVIPAHMQMLASNTIAIVVDDSAAQYPLTIDPTVGDANWLSLGGFPGTNSYITSMVRNGSDFYVAGAFSVAGQTKSLYVAKWSGGVWSALGSGMDATVNALALDSSGNLYAGGSFTTAGGVAANYIARWNGTTWSALGAGVDNAVSALVVDSSDNVIVGGEFTSASGVADTAYIARWNGSAWSALATGMDAGVNTLTINSGGILFAGGAFTAASGVANTAYIAQWNGVAWSALGTGMDAPVFAIAADGIGNVYAGGQFSVAGGVSAANIAQWNGTTWSALTTGMNSIVRSLLVDSGGTLYVGGQFTTAGGVSANRIAVWNGAAWSTLGTGMNNAVYAMQFDTGGNLYTAGGFSLINGTLNANYIAQWNGSTWSALASPVVGMDQTVQALAVSSSGTVYAGGAFINAGGASANYVAKWDGSAWAPLGTGMDNAVTALAINSSGILYAGGQFTTAGGVAASRIAQWNGSAWSPLGLGMNTTVNALAVDSNDILYAGGQFTTAGGAAASRVAQWNGTAWSPLGAGTNNVVSAIAISNTDMVYVGGQFTTAGGSAANRIAQWNGSAWSALGTGMNNQVVALTVDASGNVYAGGAFTTAGGVTASRIAKWNGTVWTALGSGVDTVGSVSALATDASGNLYAGGTYTSIGGVTAFRIAQWNGSVWSPMGAGIVGSVRALTTDSSATVLYVAGQFSAAGDKGAAHVAKWLILDTDNDGFGDASDNCPINANADQLNTDGVADGGNVCDTDDDNDSVLDGADAFPLDAAESVDTDGDTVGNNADTDDDNDGYTDADEIIAGTNPLDSNSYPLPVAVPGDTDADGLGDVVTWHQTTGNGYQYLMNSNSLRAAAPNTGVPFAGLLPSAYTQVALADFNRDGTQDVLMRNNSNGTWAMFEFAVGSPGATAMNVPMSAALANVFVAAADFNNDGYKDVLLRNSGTGVWTLNLLQGDVVLSSTTVAASLSSTWQYAAAADLNGDGNADLLLRNTSTQAWFLYELSGATVLRSGALGMANAGWNFVGTGDFNADGIQDVMLRRASDGAWYEYTFNDYVTAGTTRFSSLGAVGMSTSTAWQVLALADVDGSGSTDLLLYRSSDRVHYLYGMGGVTGRTVVGATVLPMSTSASWALHASNADYNGDGKLDFLMRNTTGQWYMYGFSSYTAGAVWSFYGVATSLTSDLNAQVIK